MEEIDYYQRYLEKKRVSEGIEKPRIANKDLTVGFGPHEGVRLGELSDEYLEEIFQGPKNDRWRGPFRQERERRLEKLIPSGTPSLICQ